MALNSLIKLDQLTITAYSERAREKKIASFYTDVSIDNYSQYYAVKYQQTGGIGSSGQEANHGKTPPKKQTFNLVFDQTCVFNSDLGFTSPPPESVVDRVKHFLEVCYDYDGNIHSPRFLTLQWGELVFKCKIETADVQYSLFDKGGNPLRAEISVSFVEDIPLKERNKLDDKQSPDITHSRMIKAGDTLTAIAKEVYGNASYYLLLAKANRINHFRNLKPGTEIKLPALPELKTY